MSQQPTTPDLNWQAVAGSRRFRGFWRLLDGYRGLYFAATGAMGFSAIASAAFFFLLRYVTDELLLGDAPNLAGRLPWVAAGFIGLALLQGAFTFIAGRWAAATAEGITLRLRDYLYDHIQRLSFAYHDKTPTGELIARATSDVDAIRRFFSEQAIGFGRIFFLFTVNFIGLLTLNVRLGLLSVMLVPVVIAISLRFFQLISRRYELFQQQEARLSTVLQENLSGIRVVKAFARQEYEINKFDRENKEKYRLGRRLLMLHAYYWPTTDVLTFGQQILGFAIGGFMVIDGTITIGTFLAYLGLFGWIIWPIRNIGRLIIQMSEGLISFGRVLDIIREQREDIASGELPPASLRGEIVFDNVRFTYDADAAVLNGISFKAEAGQMIALIGSTGAGKSTLVNLLPRFYDYMGSIKLDGRELSSYPRRFLRRQIGIVQQEPFLFSRSIRDNLTYGVEREVGDDELFEATRAAAIHDVILSFPKGYDTLVGERGVTLSGGQKQRVTLARTLLKDPRILILDDATSSVDTGTEAAIRDALFQLMPGRTTFVIAHRIQTVMPADLILVMDRGRIIQRGTHETLLAEDGIYRRIFNLQAQIEADLAQELADA